MFMNEETRGENRGIKMYFFLKKKKKHVELLEIFFL